jgi:hypothetical protein
MRAARIAVARNEMTRTDKTQVSDADLRMLLDHGWEISEDGQEARLYSEGWSTIQAAIYSTKCWIEDNLGQP